MVFLINNFIGIIIVFGLIFVTTIFIKRFKLSRLISFVAMLVGVLIINFILQEHLGSEGMGEAEYSIGYRYIITGLILFLISILANFLNKRKVT